MSATDQMPPHCYHVVWRTRPRTFWQWLRREPRDLRALQGGKQ